MIVSQLSCWAWPNCCFSDGCQPIAVGKNRISAPCSAVRRAPSGNHWSQQINTPMVACLVFHALEPAIVSAVARREVELLVVERVVGDVHLAIHAHQRTVGVNDRGGVVIEAAQRASQTGEATITTPNSLAIFENRSVLGPGIALGRLEEAVVLDLAEILAAVNFLRADDLTRRFRAACFDQPPPASPSLCGERRPSRSFGVMPTWMSFGVRVAFAMRTADLTPLTRRCVARPTPAWASVSRPRGAGEPLVDDSEASGS